MPLAIKHVGKIDEDYAAVKRTPSLSRGPPSLQCSLYHFVLQAANAHTAVIGIKQPEQLCCDGHRSG